MTSRGRSEVSQSAKGNTGKALQGHFDYTVPRMRALIVLGDFEVMKSTVEGAQAVLADICFYPPVLVYPKERLAVQKCSLSL